MSISSSSAVNLALPGWAYVPGETADAEADHDTLWQAKALGAVALSRLRSGAASGAAIRDRAQRRRIFLGIARGAERFVFFFSLRDAAAALSSPPSRALKALPCVGVKFNFFGSFGFSHEDSYRS
jgi:hypothetical protein